MRPPHAPRTSPTSEARISEVLSWRGRMVRIPHSSRPRRKPVAPARGAQLLVALVPRAPPSHYILGVDAPSAHHARCRTAQATPVDLAAHAEDMPSHAERERGGSASVPAVRGARAVPAPLRRARAAPAPIWRARARPIALIVHFREVAEARVIVIVGGTTAIATARAFVGVVNGAAHHLRYRAAALGRAAFEARALAREHVGAALGARPVALSPWRAAALAAAVPTTATAAVPTCINIRTVWVCGYGAWLCAEEVCTSAATVATTVAPVATAVAPVASATLAAVIPAAAAAAVATPAVATGSAAAVAAAAAAAVPTAAAVAHRRRWGWGSDICGTRKFSQFKGFFCESSTTFF